MITDSWKKLNLWGSAGAVTSFTCLGLAGGRNSENSRAGEFLREIRDRCLEADGEKDSEMSLTWDEALAVYKHFYLGPHDGYPLGAWGQEKKGLHYLRGVIGPKKANKLLEMWGIKKKNPDKRPPGISEDEYAAMEAMADADADEEPGESSPAESESSPEMIEETAPAVSGG